MKTMLGSNLQFRRLLAAMVAGLLMSTAYAPASLAQTPTVALPDFTTIVEKADPAVVNIRTTATVPVRGPGWAAATILRIVPLVLRTGFPAAGPAIAHAEAASAAFAA